MSAPLSLEELGRKQRALRLLYFGLMGLALTAIATALARSASGALTSLGVILIFYIFVRKRRGEYERSLMFANLSRTFAGLEGLTVREKGGTGLSAEDIREARLVPLNDGSGAVSLFLGVSGKIGGMEVSLNDVALHNGRDVHCGCWMRFVLPEPAGADFRVHGTQIEEGTPPEAFMEKLGELVRYTPGELFLRVRGQNADAYIKHRVLAMPFPVNVPPSPEMLGFDPMPEFKKLRELIALLR